MRLFCVETAAGRWGGGTHLLAGGVAGGVPDHEGAVVGGADDDTGLVAQHLEGGGRRSGRPTPLDGRGTEGTVPDRPKEESKGRTDGGGGVSGRAL